jgi:glycine/serine hydroxymethyltransferase
MKGGKIASHEIIDLLKQTGTSEFMDQALKNRENEEMLAELKNKVRAMALKFPVPSL